MRNLMTFCPLRDGKAPPKAPQSDSSMDTWTHGQYEKAVMRGLVQAVVLPASSK